MKILLIEDRGRRKEQFLEKSGMDLSHYTFLKEASAEEIKAIKSSLEENDTSLLNSYDLIMTHKSAFTINEQDLINRTGKPIVYFSGGVSQAFYIESPTPCLHINSKEFYGPNLTQFLDQIKEYQIIELLILQFGRKWKLNLLLNVRDKLNQLLYTRVDSDVFPDEFDDVFSEKAISIIDSSSLRDEIKSIRKSGIRKTELGRINNIKSDLNQQIQKAIRTEI